MLQRNYGRTGWKVSEVGMGGHREGVDVNPGLARTARFFRSAAERARTVGTALDAGVDYFDTTYGCEIRSLGESLRILGRRDGLHVSGMRVDYFSNYLNGSEKDVRKYAVNEVETRLREFGFEHLDQFILGAMEGGDPLSHPRSILEDTFDALLRLRDAGKIRAIAFSCHEPDYAARLLEAYPEFDAVMTPYSFGNRAAEGALAEQVRRLGTAWIAMKTHVWRIYGVPVTSLRHLRSGRAGDELNTEAPIGRLALQFVLQNPLLSTAVPAMNSPEAVEENCGASGAGAPNPEETGWLEQYDRVSRMEKSLVLAIAGLYEENLRVRSCALGHLQWTLGWKREPIDWSGDDAEELARGAASEMLKALRHEPQWHAYVPDADLE